MAIMTQYFITLYQRPYNLEQKFKMTKESSTLETTKDL